MDKFLQLLIAYFALHNVAPPEVKATDTNREKSYLFDLPDAKDDPDHVFVFRNYFTRHASLKAKNVGVKYVQVIVRAKSQKQAFEDLQKLYLFILRQSDISQEDGNIHYLDSSTWVIFDCQEGPIKIQIDERGRHIWGLSFPVKTNIF
jgi:hypothetical protein